jgi:choline dehydrogenase-like flavoprotein
VETPRLWLNSGLPNPNGQVGRGFTDHWLDLLVGVLDRDIGSSKGPSSAARCDFPGRGSLQQIGLAPGQEGFGFTFSSSGIQGFYTNGGGMTGPWDGPAGRLVGPALKDVMDHGLDRLLNVLVLTDDDVQAENRVTLSGLPADEHGAVPKVVFQRASRSARSTANREFLARKAAALLRGAGATRVLRMDLPDLMLHVHSTMRMGRSDADSVLDASAEARWVKRLFVADNSALANSLGGPNPTLTTQALATRTAEVIFTRYFGGQAWVGRESAPVSTDPRVTSALLALGRA